MHGFNSIVSALLGSEIGIRSVKSFLEVEYEI